MILLVVWSANSGGSALTFKASSKVNLLNDDIYRWNYATVIVSSFGQIEVHIDLFNEERISGAHSGRASL